MISQKNIKEFIDSIGDMDSTRFCLDWPIRPLASLVSINSQLDADIKIPKLIACERIPRIVWAELSDYVDFMPWLDRLDWIILSGSSREPTDLDALRRVIADFRGEGVPVWLRSIGAEPYTKVVSNAYDGAEVKCVLGRSDLTGSDPTEWPKDFRNVREAPKCFDIYHS